MPIKEASRTLTPNWVMDRIYENFGCSAREVEIKDFDLAQLIANRTIPAFSRYYPWMFPYTLQDEYAVPNKLGFYYIDEKVVPTAVLG